MKDLPIAILIAAFLVLDAGAAFVFFFGDHLKAAFGTSCTLMLPSPAPGSAAAPTVRGDPKP